MENKRFLIIIGQPKAGTTSLYKWLSQHPEIEKSIVKETRFFLDKNYPLPRSSEYNSKNLSEYFNFFHDKQKKVYLESTPDYLYCNTALHIKSLLPNAKIIALHREPVARTVSSFNFYKQLGNLSNDLSFETYVEEQFSLQDLSELLEYRVIEQNKYEKYITPFRKVFLDDLIEIKFEELKTNPEAVLKDIYKEIGIQDNFKLKDFRVENKTMQAKNIFLSRLYYVVRAQVLYILKPKGMFKRYLSILSKSLRGLIEQDLKLDSISINDSLRVRIQKDSMRSD